MVVFMYGFAILLFALPAFVDVKDRNADWIVYLTALIVAGFGVFGSFALVAVVRMRVTIDASTLDAEITEGHNWLLVPRFRSVRLPLTEIRSVERRCEIFRSFGLPTMRNALSVVTTGGERIGLFSDTLGSAPTLPLDDVASAIATAAGITVTDDGTVRTQGSGLYGAASSAWNERPLDAVTAQKWQRAAILAAQIGSLVLLLVFVLRACL